MVFKKCSVGGNVFGNSTQEEDSADYEDMIPSSKIAIQNEIFGRITPLGQQLKEFFTMLAVCHTAMVELGPDGKYKY